MNKFIEDGKVYHTKDGKRFSIIHRDNFAAVALRYLNFYHKDATNSEELSDYILCDHKAEFFGLDFASGSAFDWMPYHISGNAALRSGDPYENGNKYDLIIPD